MATNYVMQRDTAGWRLQVWLSFGLAIAAAVDEHFRPEDRLYVNECLRRYLPDSLQAYLAVPAGQRALPLADGQTAQDLLLGQLTPLHQELLDREAKLAGQASAALLRQQRVRTAKARG